MGAYYTWTQGIGVTNSEFNWTHSLSITPGSLVARIFLHQATNTATVPVAVHTIGTNAITFSSGVATLMTVDVEVQMPHSIIT